MIVTSQISLEDVMLSEVWQAQRHMSNEPTHMLNLRLLILSS